MTARPAPTTDPRRTLASQAATIDRSQAIAAPQYLDYRSPTGRPTPAGPSWTARGQNAVVFYVQADTAGVALEETFTSETVLVLTDDAAAARIDWEATSTIARGNGVATIPSGHVRIHNAGTADLVLLVRADEPGWADRAANSDTYAESDPRVAPADPWPEPVGPARVRVYRTADHPDEPGRFGRIFRSRSFMVNLLPAHQGPRAASKLSPHYHVDFEQYSLATRGRYVHHIRTPWVTDLGQWRDDDHVEIGSPSLTIIPPPTIHTSQAVGDGENRLIDIFSPPRSDFSAKPGWVLNAEDYPQP